MPQKSALQHEDEQEKAIFYITLFESINTCVKLFIRRRIGQKPDSRRYARRMRSIAAPHSTLYQAFMNIIYC